MTDNLHYPSYDLEPIALPQDCIQTCPRCGYTEFFARSLEQVDEMIRARQLQEEQNNNG
jgi:hypothetical protein